VFNGISLNKATAKERLSDNTVYSAAIYQQLLGDVLRAAGHDVTDEQTLFKRSDRITCLHVDLPEASYLRASVYKAKIYVTVGDGIVQRQRKEWKVSIANVAAAANWIDGYLTGVAAK